MTEPSTVRKLVREPLLHFLLLGIGLFILYNIVAETPGSARDEIVVDDSRVDQIIARFERTWQRQPTGTELTALVESWIRDEILYREGLTMGLDRNDAVVKRRVAQKMDFITEGAVPTPDDAALQTWLDEHVEQYMLPARYAFEQVYFDPTRHVDDIDALLADALSALTENPDAAASTLGDTSMLPMQTPLSRADQIARTFGQVFASSLSELPLDQWSGPVRSGFGAHVVRITEAHPAETPPLDVVRDAVERDWMQARARESRDALYDVLKARYSVRLDLSTELSEVGDSAAVE